MADERHESSKLSEPRPTHESASVSPGNGKIAHADGCRAFMPFPAYLKVVDIQSNTSFCGVSL